MQPIAEQISNEDIEIWVAISPVSREAFIPDDNPDLSKKV